MKMALLPVQKFLQIGLVLSFPVAFASGLSSSFLRPGTTASTTPSNQNQQALADQLLVELGLSHRPNIAQVNDKSTFKTLQ